LELHGSMVAVSPSGKLAVATGRVGGGADITVYDRIVPEGRQVIATISSLDWQFFGGLAWQDEQTLLFSENGDLDTVLRWRLSENEAELLAPAGSVPDAADLLSFGEAVLAVSARGPGMNRLYKVYGGNATPILDGYGTGYAGGLGYREGLFYLGDTNDPYFQGNPGQVWLGRPLYSGGELTGVELIEAISLVGGGGSGIFSLVFDSEGDLLASTGRTLTLLRGYEASPFGQFEGAYPFPTSLAYFGTRFEPFEGDGILVVNGEFTRVGGLFAITPVPEPTSLLILVGGLAGLGYRLRRCSKGVCRG
ncbi:MAG: PEP-CTERM sorting domain-containing protein, partial [candidate division WOR-3 bacterium]